MSDDSKNKLDLSLKLLAHLKAKAAEAKGPRTKAALAAMIRTQERIVSARRAAGGASPFDKLRVRK
ncbi:MAG: hypothetical protein JO256_03125 [Alphaproteobacteria bacterium]|nr:hypothetical protein [Alphaproteobacteria bacterium]